MSQYTIKYGDTIYLIAQRFAITTEQLLAANPQITNPDSIYPGMNIVIPSAGPSPGIIIYTIRPQDTLYSIARRYDTTIAILLRLNPNITNPSLIYSGQKIYVPLPQAVKLPGCIVYASTRIGKAEIWRSGALGENPVQLTNWVGGDQQVYQDLSPMWSPDMRHIAFKGESGENRPLYVMGPCGENKTIVAQNVEYFSWSPDSSRIAFSNREGTFVAAPGGPVWKVTDRLFNPEWFPGGKSLAGHTVLEEFSYAVLAAVDITRQNFRVFDNPIVPAATVKLSPNGRYAATQLFHGSAYRVDSKIWVYDFMTKALIMLPGAEIEVQPEIIYDISNPGGWSPDSARLVYSTIVNPQGYAEIKIAAPGGGILRSYGRGFYPRTQWGPNPEWIMLALSERPGTSMLEPTSPRNIYVLNTRTDRQIKITSIGDNYSPDWSGGTCPPCV